jgi:putative transcriptional regulator
MPEYFRPQHVDVAALRKRMHMTQKQFARRFGISLPTLRHWERGDRRPRGTALMLLTVVRHNPRAVVTALLKEARRQRHGHWKVPWNLPRP